MPLQKQAVEFNFSQGLDLKSDPKQVPLGKFLRLVNSIFTKMGLLKKRNGYLKLPSLPSEDYQSLTTFNGNLTAIGPDIAAISQGSSRWVSKGQVQPLSIDTLALIRSGSNKSQCDSVVAPNGLVCTVYTDDVSGDYMYVVADSVTGQNVIAPAVISADETEPPIVFLLDRYFVIVFVSLITATYHLQYRAISVNDPTIITAATDISTNVDSASRVYEGVVANDSLYLAWSGSDMGGAIRVTYIDQILTQHNTEIVTGHDAVKISVCADETTPTPVIYVTFVHTGDTDAYTMAFDSSLNDIFTPVQVNAAQDIIQVASSALNGFCTLFFEIDNDYSYDATVPSHYIRSRVINQAGTAGTAFTLIRSLGLGSKSFIMNDEIYVVGIYDSPTQPTYFILNSNSPQSIVGSSTATAIGKLAYSNGGGYLPKLNNLPSVTVVDQEASFSYLIKTRVEPINKGQASPGALGVYSQTGINLATLNFTPDQIVTAEIGGSLNISGGFLWMYDGYLPVEQGFHLWPDSLKVTTSTSGGSITAQTYYYVAIYEWTDNQGNIFRSAPSLPVSIVTTGATSTNTVNVPTLRVTAKVENPLNIVIYRWSQAQQTYYQVTSISNPQENSLTTDSIAFSDTQADSAIVGNSILYTTGGVLENIPPNSTSVMTLFKSRLVTLDAENRNLLNFSKQVILGTPVEMSDLLTQYIAPTIGAQGDTGDITALSAMDDKCIVFKRNAIYYFTGSGPDNTGANNDFSEGIFITSTVGCANQNSIVFIPQGLMFQSDKGIWLLGRDLSTKYIGAPVEDFNSYRVKSAVTIPGTNQVRFTLEDGPTLMYDYFFDQWGSFENVPAVVSTLYEGLHTYMNSSGQVFQENPNSYIDGSRPVNRVFKTSWIRLSGLQGFQRAYGFYLLGSYISPHKLQIQVSYDYDPAIVQTVQITPENYAGTYGSGSYYGDQSPYGGPTAREQWGVFFNRQKCESVQITVTESFDASLGTDAGEGFTLSGLNFVIGVKSDQPKLRAANTTS